MKLVAIRHGETEWNTQGREMGQLDSPLTSQGVRQAHAIAHCLSRISFSALYSSGLGRAVTSAEIIGSCCGRQVRIDQGLRERHPSETVVAVTHGGFLMGFFEAMLGIPPRNGWRFKRYNGSYSVFEYSSGRWSLEVWNDIGHLDGTGTLDDPTTQAK